MKRILVDIRMIDSAGIGVFVKNILYGLRLEKDIDITLLGYAPVEGFKFIRAYSNKFSIFSGLELYFRVLPKDFDLFWTPNFNVPILFFYYKRIVTIHDLYSFEKIADYSLLKKILIRLWTSYAIKSSHFISTVSEFSKKRIDFFYGRKKDIYIVYNSVSQFMQTNIELTRPPNSRYLLFVSSIRKNKNLGFALDSIYPILKKNKDLFVYIIGDLETNLRDEKVIRKYQDHPQVVFSGKVSFSELKSFYQYANCFIFPSLYEGFGIPPLEAQTMGCPVIASNIPTNKEILNESALFFELGDGESLQNNIISILKNSNIRERYIQLGKTNVNRFSQENSVNSFLKMINYVKK